MADESLRERDGIYRGNHNMACHGYAKSQVARRNFWPGRGELRIASKASFSFRYSDTRRAR